MLRHDYNLTGLLIITGLSLLIFAGCGGGGSAVLPDAGAGLAADDGAGGAGVVGDSGGAAEGDGAGAVEDESGGAAEAAEGEAGTEADDGSGGEGEAGIEAGDGEMELLFDGLFDVLEATLSPPPDAELIYASYDTVAGTLQVVGEAHSVGPGSQVFIRDQHENEISVIADDNGAFAILPTVVPISTTLGVTQIMGSQPESKTTSVTVWFY